VRASRIGRRVFGAVAVFFASFHGVLALAAPTDVVPRGDVAYDLLGSLASAGRLPGYTLRDFARGDRLYTRAEIARIVARIPKEDSATSDPQNPFATAERVLRSEFATELRQLGSEVAPNSATPAKSGDLTGLVKVRAMTGPLAATGTLRFATALPIGRDGYAVLSGSNYRYEWYDPSMPGASTASRANQHFDYPVVETAFVRENGRFLDVSVGKMPVRWGPGIVGGMLYSDDAATVPQIRVEKGFRLWGWLGRQLGPLYFTQFQGFFQEDDVPTAPDNARGTQRYLGGRRFETAGDSRWNFAFSEAFKSTRLPQPLFAQILPYYLYQNEWTENSRRHFFPPFLVRDPEPNTNWFNYVADVNASYRTDRQGTTVYADLFLDDVKAPAGIGVSGSDTPRKLGQQYGVHVPDLGGVGRYGLWVELAIIDPGTYTNISPPVAWSEGGIPLGYPTGPNANVLFGRFDALVTDRIRAAIEGQTRRRRSTADDSTEPNIDRIGLYGTYTLRRDAFVGARYEWQKTTALAAAPARKLSRLEINAGFGF
jgi:hypothetical protein